MLGRASLVMRRRLAAGHDHVNVRVVRHRRSPGMENGGEANPGAEMLDR